MRGVGGPDRRDRRRRRHHRRRRGHRRRRRREAPGRRRSTTGRDHAAAPPRAPCDHRGGGAAHARRRRRPPRRRPTRSRSTRPRRHGRPTSRSRTRATRRRASWRCRTSSPRSASPTSPTTAAPPRQGVTADTITVVVYLAPDTDPVLDFITAPINNDDTNDQIQATYQGYTDMFNSLYQTYGRKVELKFLDALGQVRQRGRGPGRRGEGGGRDGRVRRVGRPGARSRLDRGDQGPRRHLPRLPGDPRPAPVVFPIVASGPDPAPARRVHRQEAQRQARGVRRRPRLQDQDRVFGQIFIDTPASRRSRRRRLQEASSPTTASTLDGADAATPSTRRPCRSRPPASSKLKAAGVTTVILNADPIAPKSFTEEATKQDYFPEWVYGGSATRRHQRVRPHLRPDAVGARVRHQLAARHACRRTLVSVRPVHVVLRQSSPGRRHLACSSRSRRCSSPGCRRPGRT